MTEKEIIGAMYYCRDFDVCSLNCPFNGKEIDCQSVISKYALDIIDYQKAEIERLKSVIKAITESEEDD